MVNDMHTTLSSGFRNTLKAPRTAIVTHVEFWKLSLLLKLSKLLFLQGRIYHSSLTYDHTLNQAHIF